jgi:hypothetical protein
MHDKCLRVLRDETEGETLKPEWLFPEFDSRLWNKKWLEWTYSDFFIGG